MSYAPCLNPNCKSQGKPHPNCRCYAEGVVAAAGGGEVRGFCAQGIPHEPSCEHYMAEGGEVAPHEREALNDHLIGDPSEESRWILGNEDHEASVSNALLHSGARNLLDGDMNGVYSVGGLRALADKKIEKKISKYLANPLREPVERFVKKAVGMHTNKLAAPLLARMINNGETKGFSSLLSYANNIKKGSKLSQDAVESLFKKGGSYDASVSKEDRDKLNDFIASGKLYDQIMTPPDTQAMAHGGEVKQQKSIFHGTDAMEKTLPTHNVMIQMAKGRVNSYLNSIRPSKNETSLFDPEFEDDQKKRSYERALDVANRPISVVAHIKNGSILPDHVNHLKSLYPEVYSHLAKQMHEKIIQAKLKKERPDYIARQGMSLFLGTHLDSTLSPQFIQAAQRTFLPTSAQPEPQPAQKASKKQSLDKAPDDDFTMSQAREKRQNKT